MNAPPRAPSGPLSVAPLFRRAFYWQPPATPDLAAGSVDNSARLSIPTGIDSLRRVLRWPPSLPRLIAWLESPDAQLRTFEMTFHTIRSVGADGRPALRYEFRYETPDLGAVAGAAIHLRFSDRNLHRLLFNRARPVPIGPGGAAPTLLGGALPALGEDGRIVERTARLQVLLPDRRTVVASIPIAYPAPGR